jgi:hypothetical protein
MSMGSSQLARLLLGVAGATQTQRLWAIRLAFKVITKAIFFSRRSSEEDFVTDTRAP